MSYKTAAKHTTKRVCALQPRWERLHPESEGKKFRVFQVSESSSSSHHVYVLGSCPLFRSCLRFHIPQSRHSGFTFIAKPCCLHPRYPFRHVLSRRYRHAATLFLGRHISTPSCIFVHLVDHLHPVTLVIVRCCHLKLSTSRHITIHITSRLAGARI
jgi:hypothetical protein